MSRLAYISLFSVVVFSLLAEGNSGFIDVENDVIDEVTPYLVKYEQSLVNWGLNKEAMLADIPNWAQTLSCAACETAFDNLIELIHSGNVTYFEVQDRIVEACVTLQLIGNQDVCEGFFNISMPSLAYIFNHTTNLTGNEICGTLLVIIGCTYDEADRYWTVDLTATAKPVVTEPPYNNSVPIMKVLHLSDTHYDPLYAPGGNANCPEKYLCCRNDSVPLTEEDEAWFWGDYRNCDAPKWLLEETFRHISTQHPDLDFIIWTGDLVSHNLWSTSKSYNLDIISETVDMIKQFFPNTPVYPAVGNHEGQPANTFPQPYVDDEPFNIDWLYGELAILWSDWIDATAQTTVSYGGYYSAMIKEGLKILSLNSNYCYGFNWWLIMDDHDVAEVLEFMVDELQKSEDNGEKVYIISHHPSGSFDCAMTWSHEYNKIVARYEHTIAGLFYGHTHNDHYHLFFDPEEPTRVYETGFIAQSQTPYSYLNPGYKIYHIEGDYEGSMHRVLDHENWIMDLEIAHTLNMTEFYQLYTARDVFGLDDLSPQSLLDLVFTMNVEGSTEFDLFYRNYVKDSSPKLRDGCDANCKHDVLCQLLVADNSDHSHCDSLL